MNLPAGLIFYLDFQYGSANGDQAVGDSLYAASSDLKKTELPGVGENKGLYGAGTYGYSINTASVLLEVTGSTADFNQVDASIASIGGFAGTASFGNLADDTAQNTASLGGDTEFISSVQGTNVDEFRISTSSFTNPDLESVRLWSLAGSGITANYNQFNRYDAADGAVMMYANNGGLANDGALTVTYVKGPDNLDDVGDFEEGKNGSSASDTSGNVGDLKIPSIDVQLRSDTVSAKTRRHVNC